MDEKLQALVDMALAERFSIAFAAMQAESCVDAEQVVRLVELSEQVERHPGISNDARATVQEFLSLDADNNARFQRYLYIQGAKDCAACGFFEGLLFRGLFLAAKKTTRCRAGSDAGRSFWRNPWPRKAKFCFNAKSNI